MTRDEAYDRFMRELRRRGLTRSTVAGYRRDLGALFRWLGLDGTDDITVLSVEGLEAFQQHLARQDLTAATKRGRMMAVGRFTRFLAREGILFADPASGLALAAREPRRLPHVLSVRDVERILAVPDTTRPTGMRDRCMLEVAYGSALRRGELLGLELEDVDLDTRRASIRQGKGGRDRVVPLVASASDWIRRYLEEARPRFASPEHPTRALFLASRVNGASRAPGQRLTPGQYHRILRAIGRAAGLRGALTGHSLRRACGTHLLEGGASIVAIQRLLGHADPAVTEAYYVRLQLGSIRRMHAGTHPAEHSPDRWTLGD